MPSEENKTLRLLCKHSLLRNTFNSEGVRINLVVHTPYRISFHKKADGDEKSNW